MRSLPAEKDYPDRTRTALQQQYSASKLDIEKVDIAECVTGDEKAVLSGKSQPGFQAADFAENTDLAQDGVYPEAGVDIGSDSGSDLDDPEDEELDDISDDSADQDTQMDEDPPLKVHQQNIPYDYRLI